MIEWLRTVLSKMTQAIWSAFLEKPVEHIAQRILKGEFNELLKDVAKIVVPIIVIFAVLDILINMGWLRKPGDKKRERARGAAERDNPPIHGVFYDGETPDIPAKTGRVRNFLSRLTGRGRVKLERVEPDEAALPPDPELWPEPELESVAPAPFAVDSQEEPVPSKASVELDLNALRETLAGEVMEMEEREAQEFDLRTASDEPIVVLKARHCYTAAESRKGRLKRA